MRLRIENEWDNLFKDVYNQSFYLKLETFLYEEYQNHTVFPKKEDLFTAFRLTEYNKIKAVIIGQDPYHCPHQAHGIVFSVPDGITVPPSLKNIYKELNDDLGIEIPPTGNLTKWADEGVLLLNTVLTVRKNQPLSHRNRGWEQFTEKVIALINQKASPVVYFLWGKVAQTYEKLITSTHHLILKGAHPSPLSAFRGFFGGHYFSRCNHFLEENNITPIDWRLK
ncbi:MAG: uracil-DNA glycosylase [Bacilli bacterium]|nr:uracil-DNA glycosylase [Bacilli bacterium]